MHVVVCSGIKLHANEIQVSNTNYSGLVLDLVASLPKTSLNTREKLIKLLCSFLKKKRKIVTFT